MNLIDKLLCTIGLKKPTVDAVVSRFHKIVAELEAVVTHHTAAAEKHMADAHASVSASNASNSEALQAQIVAGKIKGLLS
jgi:hypothetical protein